jgi:hypothetical protein
MMFTALDAASLSKALARWELAEYISCGLVAIACAGEYIAEFTNWLTGGDEESKHRLRKRSTLLLISALAFELVCLVRTNTLSGMLIGSLDKEAGDADDRAKAALANSGIALTQSSNAVDSSKQAIDESNRATASGSGALTLARDARHEADSFEKDIVSAKTQATEAESHLADALKQAADAKLEVDRVKAPRSLINSPQLVSALTIFKDTQYTFSAVCQEEECINLLKSIDALLQSAGWKRTKPPHGFPSINVYGSDADFAVTVALTTGIHVSCDAEEPLATFQPLTSDQWPQLVRTAVVLNLSLSSNISPPQEAIKVDVQQGTSPVIRISVGKKP